MKRSIDPSINSENHDVFVKNEDPGASLTVVKVFLGT